MVRMARELLLHLGGHKTGTTSIQRTMASNSEALAAQGATYIATPGQSHLHHALGPAPDVDIARRGFHICNEPLLRELFAQPSQPRVIGSSENFSFLFDPSEIQRLWTISREAFDRVRILVYLRRQDTHVVSHHQEGAKPDRAAEAAVFGNALRAIPWDGPGLDFYLDYNSRIGHWLDTFGPENVTVRVWDNLADQDVWSDFARLAEFDATEFVTLDRQNVSIGLAKAKVGHMMNALDLPPGLVTQIMQVLPDDEKMLPSRADAQCFYDRYKGGNIVLNRRLGATDGSDLFQNDFSTYPLEARETWTEDSAGAVIEALLKLIGAKAVGPDANQLRDAAALADAADQPRLALALIKAAERLRPEGILIRKKRQEYSKRVRQAADDRAAE